MATVAEALDAGWQLYRRGDLDGAEAAYRQVLQAAPENAAVWCFLGLVCYHRNRLTEAVASYRQAIRLDPGFDQAYNNLGNALLRLDQFEEAVGCFQHVLQRKPDYALAHNNLGYALVVQGRFDEAMACFDRTLELMPDHALAHSNRALIRLLQGDFERGWPEYEWRRQTDQANVRHFSQPPWDGRPLTGQTILLYADQGLGDTIQLVRYAPLVKERVGRVVFECERPLLQLLSGCAGVDQWVARGETLPAFDVHAALLSLPKILRISPDNIVANVPYLAASLPLVERWQATLQGLAGFRIGVSWKARPGYHGDGRRSIPLVCFAPLAELPGTCLINLQKGTSKKELDELGDRLHIVHLGDDLDTASGAFMDTAAVMKNLDLVVTADTVIAHLAGALGVPVWTALPLMPSWPWMLGRDDSPWYPTMRLFRQTKLGDWTGVFQEIQRALCDRVSPEHRRKPRSARAASAGNGPLLENRPVRLKQCRHGPMLYLATDQYIGQSLDRYGEYSEGEVDVLRQAIRPGSTILEIGANLGAHTVPLAKAVGPSGAVHVFEPQRIVFQILCANVALNALGNVHAHHVAVGREAGEMIVPRLDYAAFQNFGGISLGGWSQGDRVPMITVDSLALSACHLVKIDVEGMEGDVIAGAEQSIRRLRPVLYVENDRQEKSAALIRQIVALEYRLYWHFPPLFNPHNYFGTPENIFGRIVSANMLGLHTSVSQNVQGLREITSPDAETLGVRPGFSV